MKFSGPELIKGRSGFKILRGYTQFKTPIHVSDDKVGNDVLGGRLGQGKPADCEGKCQGPKSSKLDLISLSLLRLLVFSVMFYTPL